MPTRKATRWFLLIHTETSEIAFVGSDYVFSKKSGDWKCSDCHLKTTGGKQSMLGLSFHRNQRSGTCRAWDAKLDEKNKAKQTEMGDGFMLEWNEAGSLSSISGFIALSDLLLNIQGAGRYGTAWLLFESLFSAPASLRLCQHKESGSQEISMFVCLLIDAKILWCQCHNARLYS